MSSGAVRHAGLFPPRALVERGEAAEREGRCRQAMTDDGPQHRDARMAAILDAAPECVIAIDASGRVLDANPAAELTFGYPAGGLVGRAAGELLVLPEVHEPQEGYFERRLAAVLGRRADMRARRADGSCFSAEVTITRPGGRARGLYSAHLRDVSEEREAGEALQAVAREQAALRRLAVAVASEADLEQVACVVTEQVGRLLGAHTANMVRYDDEPTATVVGGWSAGSVPSLPVGSAIPLDGPTVAAQVRRTGRPARVDSYDDLKGELARRLRDLGFRSAVGAPVMLSGRLWGAVMVSSVERDPFAANSERRIGEFCALVAQALANAEAREQLAASRARIVQAGDTERRRLERNLHDGAQQRLVAVLLTLRLAERRLPAEGHLARILLEQAGGELEQALAELRELARGLHPAVLTERGLEAALAALAARAPVPVDIAAALGERLPEPVEAAAYYMVAEALTNVAKYAQAEHATVRVLRAAEHVEVTVTDDGVGGADHRAGSGLRGLADRVEALGGQLEVRSPPGGGTTMAARIPLGA